MKSQHYNKYLELFQHCKNRSYYTWPWVAKKTEKLISEFASLYPHLPPTYSYVINDPNSMIAIAIITGRDYARIGKDPVVTMIADIVGLVNLRNIPCIPDDPLSGLLDEEQAKRLQKEVLALKSGKKPDEEELATLIKAVHENEDNIFYYPLVVNNLTAPEELYKVAFLVLLFLSNTPEALQWYFPTEQEPKEAAWSLLKHWLQRASQRQFSNNTPNVDDTLGYQEHSFATV